MKKSLPYASCKEKIIMKKITERNGLFSTALMAVAGLLFTTNIAFADMSNIAGDLDGDCDVDKNDINIIFADRNTPARGSDDARDLDHDGMITALDARKLSLLCDEPRCQVVASTCSVEELRNVIFFHPDGYGLSHWNGLRFWLKGPDGKLNWDRLGYMAPYTGHMKDALTSSSHGGATVHAYGVKVAQDSFGLDEQQVITALSSKQMSIMEEAVQAGFATALIQSGSITEPGTAAFVSSVEKRSMRDEIAKQVIESGVDVILSGGESRLLPAGIVGRHGVGKRADDLNLIEMAEELGYIVVYNQDELMAIADDVTATRVLGIFASNHTFNAATEEALRTEGLPQYWPDAPTIAEMSATALKILARNPKADAKGIFVVAEEEGTDNFGNRSNASGSFEAGKRADNALGVFADFVEENPNTLLITAADSGAGAKTILGPNPALVAHLQSIIPDLPFNTGADGEWVLMPLDGVDGAGTELFQAASDKEGNRWPFAVAWINTDGSGHVVARAMGLNAELVTELGVVDNTDVYRIMYYTMFGEWLGEDY